MENKKQLIIIPPMSEALKKLNEVLEGISTDENVEITIIDDLKELAQFLATTGQCLILASNAKKCATFLQENRATLLKHHCKTILFTPKEIPAKTLVKFTKIGLTESILENSPPKTFLYKVKLLLRSIKTAKPQEDAEKLVKSLDVKAQADESLDRDVKEKSEAEENVIDMERPNKKKQDDSGETIDYSNPLKGKIKPQEENLDTNWKSDRKKDATGVYVEEEGNISSDSEVTAIDMYYRGKSKKNDTLDLQADDDFGKLKKSLEIGLEEGDKKKSSYADIVDEGSMKQKRLDTEEATPEDAPEKVKLVDLDLLPGAAKKKKLDDEEQEMGLRNKLKPLDEELEEGPKTKEKEVEDLGGYLKGKVSHIEEIEEESESVDKKEYDNSGIEDDKDPNVELDLLAADKKARKDNIESEEEGNGPHEGEVDHIEGDMIGDAGTVEQIRTRMSGSFDGSAPEDLGTEEVSFLKKAPKLSPTEEEDMELDPSLDIEAAEKERAKRENGSEEDEDMDLREKSTELELTPANRKALTKDELPEDEIRNRDNSPLLEKIKKDREGEIQTPEEEETDLRSRTQNSALQKEKKDHSHDGQVDKIDTFYRSTTESKKTDQDWGNLTDKKSSLDLLPGKGKRADETSAPNAKKDLGEITIDYRKLKEEFDMMSEGRSSENGAFSTTKDTTLKNHDDDGSFRVVEIDPKSLDFSISVINAIYQKDIKAKQIFSLITDEILSSYHCYPVFYTYKLSDKKFTETFNSFIEVKDNRIPAEQKEWWHEFKKDTALFEHYQSKSMTTWRCPEIIKDEQVWEDVELPTWAEQELKNKKVELIFPYFDGLDRMGMAVLYFPEGINPKTANGLLTVLEMARTLFLDTIQRYQVQPLKEKLEPETTEEAATPEKKNVLSFFGGMFGKKKAG